MGGVYLHCDQTMSHYLKLLLDCIFGKENFLNEIIWCYKENDTATKYFPRKHDVILFYSKSKHYIFNIQRGEITEAQKKRYNHIINGERYANMKGKMRKLVGGAKIRDWWEMPIVQSSERTDYPTQKPLALLRRIIKASSNPGDLVLDPFCGCATTCVAAELEERKWVGIDVSHKAFDLVEMRLDKEIKDLYRDKPIFKTTPPERNADDLKETKYVYIICSPSLSGYYKVGVSKDMRLRLGQYQTSTPFRDFEVRFKHETPDFNEIEKHIHEKYNADHEWVTGNYDDIVKDIINWKPEHERI